MEFIDLKRQYARLRESIDSAIGRVLDHGQFIMGPEVRELEERLAVIAGTRHCLTCSSGTDALTLAMMALGVGPGDAVFTTPFSFFATTEAILREGATPVFCDIDPETYMLDPSELERTIVRIVSDGKLKPKAVVTVDLFGMLADYRRIRKIADQHGLAVIEDAAQSLGSELNGRKAPSFGTIGCTSFFPTKALGCYGDGGAVFTDDDALAETIASLRVHGQGESKYDNRRVGINGRLDTIQAAILLEKLSILDDEAARRRAIAESYSTSLPDEIMRQHPYPGNRPSWTYYSVRHPERDRLIAALKKRGVPTTCYYPRPLHLLEATRHLGAGSMPHAEAVASTVFSLPMHPYLTTEEQNKVISAVRELTTR